MNDLVERAESLSRALFNLCMDDDAEVVDKLIEALKPVEDTEVQELLKKLRTSWDGEGSTYRRESPLADFIERLAREKAEIQARVEELEGKLRYEQNLKSEYLAMLGKRDSIAADRQRLVEDLESDKKTLDLVIKTQAKIESESYKRLQAKVEELTSAWKDSIDGVERIAFDMEPPNKHTPRFIMWVNQMRNELNRIKSGG